MSFGDQRGTRSCVCMCARVHACVQERALRGISSGTVRHGAVEPGVSPAGHDRPPCCSVLAALCCMWTPWGLSPCRRGPVPTAHSQRWAAGPLEGGPAWASAPSMGLGPQHGPPSSPGLLLSLCLAQTDLARAEGSGLLQQAHREDRRRRLKAPGRPAARRGRKLPDGLASVSWRFKASVSVSVRLLGKLWEANLLIHCG